MGRDSRAIEILVYVVCIRTELTDHAHLSRDSQSYLNKNLRKMNS